MKDRNRPTLVSVTHLLEASLVMLVLIAVSGAIFIARARSSKEAPSSPSTKAANYAVPPTLQNEHARQVPELESEVITITRRGFEPREITRPAGRFLLLIENRTNLSPLVLQVRHNDGQGGREIRLTREDSDWTGLLNLQPGRYLLNEVNHPRWSCQITVTQQ
jgi:hypothetical protein